MRISIFNKTAILRSTLFRYGILVFLLFILCLICYFSPYPIIFKIKDILIGTLSGALVLVTNYCISRILFRCVIMPKKSNIKHSIVISKKLNLILKSNLFIIMSTIFIAIVEEVAFRSFLLSLTNRHFSIIVSILINIIAFSLFHFNSKIIQLMFMGLIFSIITIYTENLLPAIIAHFTNNYLSHIYKKNDYSLSFWRNR